MQVTIPVESEALNPEELHRITGRPRAKEQLQWLDAHGWRYETTAANEPVVGRLYARFKLAGVDLAAVTFQTGPAPDFTKAR